MSDEKICWVCQGRMVRNPKRYRGKAWQQIRACSKRCRDQGLVKDKAETFWSYVKKTDGCWLWKGYRDKRGYGRFTVGHRGLVATRWLWAHLHGPIPQGMQVCHHCDNPPCVRPDHLFLGTASDNQQDSVRKGRHWMQRAPLRGERHGSSKLSDAQRIEIRRLRASGERSAVLAQRYGVSIGQIQRIASGKVRYRGRGPAAPAAPWLAPAAGPGEARE